MYISWYIYIYHYIFKYTYLYLYTSYTYPRLEDRGTSSRSGFLCICLSSTRILGIGMKRRAGEKNKWCHLAWFAISQAASNIIKSICKSPDAKLRHNSTCTLPSPRFFVVYQGQHLTEFIHPINKFNESTTVNHAGDITSAFKLVKEMREEVWEGPVFLGP